MDPPIARGYFTTRADTHPKVNARRRCLLARRSKDMSILDGRDDRQRAELIA